MDIVIITWIVDYCLKYKENNQASWNGLMFNESVANRFSVLL